MRLYNLSERLLAAPAACALADRLRESPDVLPGFLELLPPGVIVFVCRADGSMSVDDVQDADAPPLIVDISPEGFVVPRS